MIPVFHEGKKYELDIDVAEELSVFDWNSSTTEGDEFKACSPFRNERKPSFYVNLETGLFIDHGAESEDWKQGDIVKLLSFLYNQSYEETEEYLLEKYNVSITEVEGLELKINIQLEEKKEPKIFTREELKPYLYRNKGYLLHRGISEEVQKKFIVGYSKKDSSVAFFWLDAFTGKVVNVKFRSTKGKQFYYIRGGQPVRNHIFGLWQVLQEYDSSEPVYIVESEIDAMYLWTHGIKAIALGGSHLSEQQKKTLLMSGIEHFVIATDNDKAGRRIKESIKKELGGMVLLDEIELPYYAKDINEVKPEDMKKVTDSAEPITFCLSLHFAV